MLDLQRPAIPIYVYRDPIGQNGASLMTPFDVSDPSIEVHRFSSISARVADEEKVNDKPDGAGEATAMVQVQEFKISFWVDEDAHCIFSTRVAAPLGWSSRMYLAAINITIRRQNLVICSPKRILGGTYTTLNYVHSLYSITKEASLKMLQKENSFSYVLGGHR